MPEGSSIGPETSGIMKSYLLQSAQEQAQIFETLYEHEKREHAKTKEDFAAAAELLELQRLRLDWLLGGELP